MTNQGMRSLALGVLLLSSLALMANAEERRLPRQLPDAPPPAREGVDDFTPLRGTAGQLAGSNDPRLGVMPGVAWTPGLPGGGGGSGGPWEPAVASGYTVGAVLPCLDGVQDCYVLGASRSGAFLAGSSPSASQHAHPCLSELGEPIFFTDSHAVIWELGPGAGPPSLHDLPNTVPAGGSVRATAHGANTAGLVVGGAFLEWVTTDCSDYISNGYRSRAVIWNRSAGSHWVQGELPTGTGRSEAGRANGVSDAGWIVGSLWIRGDGTERSGPVVWTPDSSEASGWRLDWLPIPAGAARADATLINDGGTIAGWVRYDAADGTTSSAPLVWQVSRFGRWLVTELATLGGDSALPRHLTQDGQLLGQSTTGVMQAGQGNDEDVEQKHAARWRRDRMSGTWSAPEDLGTLDGHGSWAQSQIGTDFVVGASTINTRDQREYRALAWDDGAPIQLDTITQGQWTFTDAWEVLPSGRIVVKGFERGSGPTQLMILEPNAP